jgi:hypothetical protein
LGATHRSLADLASVIRTSVNSQHDDQIGVRIRLDDHDSQGLRICASALKFSSAASGSIEGVFLLAPGYQSFPYAGRRKPSLDFLSNGCGLFMACVKVGGNCGLVAQVVRDHGVHVRQGNRGVLLRNLLGSRTSVERRDNSVEGHPRTGDTHDAVGVSVNRNPLNRFGRIHRKHS